MGTKKGGRRWTARRAYMPAKTKFTQKAYRKRKQRRERRQVAQYRGGIELGKNMGNMTNAMGRWVRARFRMFD